MKIQAVVFDIYKTLLEVLPPPEGAEAQWEILGRELPGGARLSLMEFDSRSRDLIAKTNDEKRQTGVAYPEVFWPDIATSVMPELKSLSSTALDDFLFRHAQLQRAVRLMPGADSVLTFLAGLRRPIGICSNSQPYTLRELAGALAVADGSIELFHPRLRFLSFEAGFSKPDRAVYRLLKENARHLGFQAGQLLMVGDRLDNDIEPAAAEGWQTWHLHSANKDQPGGDMAQLLEYLRWEHSPSQQTS